MFINFHFLPNFLIFLSETRYNLLKYPHKFHECIIFYQIINIIQLNQKHL